MSTIINAVCKFPPRDVVTRFGQKINAVFVLDSGEEHTAWGLPSDEQLKLVAKGQKVKFLKEDNGKLKLAEVVSAEAEPTKALAQDDLEEFAASVAKYVRLYDYCLEQVKANINKELLDTESIRSIATSIFIQTTKGV